MSAAFSAALRQIQLPSWSNEPTPGQLQQRRSPPDNAARRARNGKVREAILAEVRRRGPINYVELGEATGFAKMTLRNHVMQLEDAGLVRRSVIEGTIYLEATPQ